MMDFFQIFAKIYLILYIICIYRIYIIVFTHNFLMNIKYSLVLLFKILFSIMTLLTILKKIIEIKD